MEQLTQQQLNRLFQMPESQQLLKLLQKSSDTAWSNAAAAATAGDFIKAKQFLMPALQDPEMRSLIEKLSTGLG